MTVFLCAHCRRLFSHFPSGVVLADSEGSAARAPCTSSLRKYLLPTFADPHQPWLPAGRHLPRHQAEPGGNVAPRQRRAHELGRRMEILALKDFTPRAVLTRSPPRPLDKKKPHACRGLS